VAPWATPSVPIMRPPTGALRCSVRWSVPPNQTTAALGVLRSPATASALANLPLRHRHDGSLLVKRVGKILQATCL
jgi:hypothetical protein